MPKLHVVIASTRPGRTGLPVGAWFFECAKLHGKFDVELIDLKEVNLPFLDEPQHPRLRQYEHAHRCLPGPEGLTVTANDAQTDHCLAERSRLGPGQAMGRCSGLARRRH